ncbi:Oidioi.mRNA.OKI2018_I69.PAR.g12867.t1.cds [Oikopleura dioica]|uniref:Oidioi.mRNA.OKI2018_I69.PAR.g12867.t1.cds n=1 Tax=Oikopleura dioica TaxID=34765 RepID=A0ABN7S6K2_OIKDI|nr:Oidioi.mRNA.OKI2018_I69.PAR.g12867.t1.cds [Oikopleura dioica]
MKLFGITLALASAQGLGNETEDARHYFPEPHTTFYPRVTLPPPKSCWKCEGENYGLCMQQHNINYGFMGLTCPYGKVCSIVERRRGGKIEWVSMGCKDEDVCKEEQQHNIRPCPQMPTATECHQMIYGHSYEKVPSVCRKCFDETNGAKAAGDFIRKIGIADANKKTPPSLPLYPDWMGEEDPAKKWKPYY